MGRAPTVLYHYCSVETFHSIMSNKILWLSDISKSNDSQELRWIKNQCQLYVSKAWVDYVTLLKQNSRLSEADFDKFEEYSNIIEKMCQKETEKCWALCLTQKKDDLGQWRGYAKNGTGISIGFKSRFFKRLSNEHPPKNIFDFQLCFDKVSYTKRDVKRLFYDSCHFSEIDIGMTNQQIIKYIEKAIVYAMVLAPFYKKEEFKEEKEWRLTYSMSMADLKDGKVPSLELGNLTSTQLWQYKYEVINGTLVSHLELYNANLSKEISEICLGPKCPLSVSEVKLFLISTKMLKDFDDQSIKVYRSSASYR